MGGKKKPTLSQLVKRMEKEKEQQQKKAAEEKKQSKIMIVDSKILEEIKKDVMKMDCVTPYIIASKYGLKMSTALNVLRTLRDQGILYLVSKGHRTEIYVPVERAKSLGLLKA
ncbi:MAG: 30S ribosomal protein S25e [Crenarchaeota archaeon]|nr:30S ribosomal protein S25e [Thermoproteota archaeon]